jgi:hypothetical protein
MMILILLACRNLKYFFQIQSCLKLTTLISGCKDNTTWAMEVDLLGYFRRVDSNSIYDSCIWHVHYGIYDTARVLYSTLPAQKLSCVRG